MKKTILVLLTALFSLTIFGQDITGEWSGTLKAKGTQLRLVFHVAKTENGVTSTMDSPDHGAKGIPTTTTSFENSILKITIANLAIEYEGTLGQDNIIVGAFKQGGDTFPVNLSKEKRIRPQEPTKPYSYISEDITFENKRAGISLAGTLTLPPKDGVYPVVILISGSGPQNRDEALFDHKPFLVLSDYLTRNGIAVLRYDDRGTALSTGDFKAATTVEFATDVEAGIEYLKTRKEIDKKKIGLIGHSEGGLIAPIVAGKSKDVAFIVLLASPGIQGDEILLLQQQLILKASGVNDEDLHEIHQTNKAVFDIVKKSDSPEQLNAELTNYLKQSLKDRSNVEKPAKMSDDDFVTLQIKQIVTPWMQYFIKYDPAPTLEKVKCPVLAINGAKDLQVPSKENLDAVKKALEKGGNKNVKTIEISGLNHLFQECKSGLPNEYGSIEQTISPVALEEILKWIQMQANVKTSASSN